MTRLLAMLGIVLQLAAAGIVYPATMVVTGVDYSADVVTVQTATGFSYQLDGAEDYTEGDLVSCLMWSGGTADDIADDLILAARYSGYWMQ